MASSAAGRRRKGPLTYVRRVVAVAYLFFIVAWPVSLVAKNTFKDGTASLRKVFDDPVATHALKLTVIVSVIAVVLNLVFGVGVSLLLVRYRFPGRRLLSALIDLPLSVSPVVVGLLAYATTVPDTIEPLPPALQNNLLLTVHVAVALLAYAAFTVAFAAGILYLIQRKDRLGWLPRSVVLDEIGYKAVMVGFPMLALAIILGAVWADIAWGTYWSWDPKETAALGTWLIYGGYLHARVIRGWRGDRSALFLVGGFAATLFTYYGNLFLGGLHSYA